MHGYSKLKELRKSRNMTTIELGRRLGLDPSTINNYEKGRRRPRKLETIVEIANVFDISISQALNLFLSKKIS